MKFGAMSCYKDEHRTYADAYRIFISDEDARFIMNKLTRHFGVRIREFKFHGHNQSGWASHGGTISMSHDPSMGLLCHEFAHQAQYQKVCKDIKVPYEYGHGLFYQATMLRVIAYARACSFWKNELSRRQTKVMQAMVATPAQKALIAEALAPKVVSTLATTPFREGSRASRIFAFIRKEGVTTIDAIVDHLTTPDVKDSVVAYVEEWATGKWGGVARVWDWRIEIKGNIVTWFQK